MFRQRNKAAAFLNDLSNGQVVIIAARWVLVMASLLLTLLGAGSFNAMRFQVLVILLLAMANFYLCAQVLRKKKTLEAVIYGASLADLAVITILIIMQGGLESNIYTFYFPAILTLSVVFPTFMLFFYLGGTLSVYALIGVASADTAEDLQILVVRLLMLVAVAVCGNLYWRMENSRRQAALDAQKPAPTLPLDDAAPLQPATENA